MPGRMDVGRRDALFVQPAAQALHRRVIEIAAPHGVGKTRAHGNFGKVVIENHEGSNEHDMARRIRLQCFREGPVCGVSVELVKQCVPFDVNALVMGQEQVDVRPVRLRNFRVSGCFQNHRCIKVHDEMAPGFLGRPVDGHDAVDILGRGVDEIHAFASPDVFHERVLDFGFRLESGVRTIPANGRAFQEKRVDIRGRVLDHGFEQFGLASVRTEIAGIEQSLAIGLDQ